MINAKGKGTAAERELIKMLWDSGWAAMRAAGSGCAQHPSPDILAGNGIRRLAIECKSIADNRKYLTKDEIDQLMQFSRTFGAEAWIGIRFSGKKWFFLNTEDLNETEKNHVISLEIAERRGLSFEELTFGMD